MPICTRHWVERRAADDIAVVSATAQELPRLLVLIPCRASIYDLEASQHTAGQIKKAGGKQAAFVLNAVPSRGARAQEAREALEGLLPVSPVELHHLVAYSDALNDGRSVEEMEPLGKAAQEIRALYDWLIEL